MPTREDIIHDILSKKELKGIEHSFVIAMLDKELRRQPKIAKKLDTLSKRSADYKNLTKAVRSVLRRNIGLYEGDPRHREALLAQLRQSPKNKEIITHILSTHASTRERLPYYDKMYKQIFAFTNKPKTVLDIGCGLNPISYPDQNATYIGVDIDRALCLAVETYFRIVGVEGQCKVVDVRGMDQIKNLPKADVAFAFKLFDLVEQKGHKLAELIIQALPAKWVIVSFPTLTSSGKPMTSPRRAWIEKMLDRTGLKYTRFSIPNEMFYVINKG